ncbi:MAG: peptidoglycan editing factor PgeF [Candidatus Nanopelagicales bacterium]
MSPRRAGTVGAARWLFTDRTGGVSAPPYDSFNLATHVGDDPDAVATNRSRLAAEVGVAPARLVLMHPTHGAGVAVVDGPVADGVADVDALVTAVPGLALVALAADCVPVLLLEPDAGVVAAVHSGWRGVAVDVVGAALYEMATLGARPDRTLAVLGPCICPRCYAVPEERRAEVAMVAPASRSSTPDGRPSVDLRAGIAERLEQAGVHVLHEESCTAEDPALFSYRRDGRTGRQAGVVLLAP